MGNWEAIQIGEKFQIKRICEKTPKFFVDQKRAERKGYQINYITDVIRISFLMYSFSFHNGSCTNKNWPYFVILFVKRRALGHVSVRAQNEGDGNQNLGWRLHLTQFSWNLCTRPLFSFQTSAVKGVDRFTISRFQLLLNSKFMGTIVTAELFPCK